jgi:uncharacterized membrane protein
MEAAMTKVFAVAVSILTISLGTVALSFKTIDVEAGPLSVYGTAAQSSNERGDVVGATMDQDFRGHAYMVRNGVVTYFNIPGTWGEVIEAWPRSINASGDIAGVCYRADGTYYGFLRSHHGKWTRLEVPGAEGATHAHGINGPGEIVGVYGTNGGKSASGFLFRPGHDGAPGSYLSIDYPGANATEAWGINDDGDVVGVYSGSDGIPHGFLQHEGDFTTVDVPGADGTAAVGINSRGEIAGQFFHADDFVGHGFLLSKGTYTTFDVPDVPDAVATVPMSINNRGEIVGFYLVAPFMAHGFKAVKAHH